MNFDSVKEAIYKVLKWKKGLFFPHINWEISCENKKWSSWIWLSCIFPFFFYFLTFCVILGPPTSKCQDRIKCLWEEVGRQGWASCQISVWVWLQVKERGRKDAGRLGEGLWEHSTVWGRFGRAVREFWSQSSVRGSLCLLGMGFLRIPAHWSLSGGRAPART